MPSGSEAGAKCPAAHRIASFTLQLTEGKIVVNQQKEDFLGVID
jgi:hypothetical protein